MTAIDRATLLNLAQDLNEPECFDDCTDRRKEAAGYLHALIDAQAEIERLRKALERVIYDGTSSLKYETVAECRAAAPVEACTGAA